MLDDLTDLLAFEAGEPRLGERNAEDDDHEHRCPSCGAYWLCRRADCRADDTCEWREDGASCERKAKAL